jgi:hypothetical protein
MSIFAPFAFIKEVGGGVTPTPSVVTTGLVSWYDAGDTDSYPGSGTTLYDLQENNDLTFYLDNVNFTSDGASSYFSGNSGSPSLARKSGTTGIPSGKSTISYGGWYYYNDISTFSGVLNSGIGADGVGSGGTQILYPNSSGTTLTNEYGSGVGVVTATTSTSNSTWYHQMVTIENTGGSNRTIKIYRQGVEVGSGTITTDVGDISTASSGPLIYVGGLGGSDINDIFYKFDGRWAVHYIYDIALTAAQVEQNYDADKARYGY